MKIDLGPSPGPLNGTSFIRVLVVSKGAFTNDVIILLLGGRGFEKDDGGEGVSG